jgi:hypothetical protein
MKPTLFAIATILPLLAGVIPTAHAVECAAGVVRAGGAGPNRGRRRRTTRGSGGRNERNAYEIGPSSWHDGHRRARQHRNQSSRARLCFRKWRAGLLLTL